MIITEGEACGDYRCSILKVSKQPRVRNLLKCNNQLRLWLSVSLYEIIL